MYRYLQNHTAQCEVCQKCKPSTKTPKAPLLPICDPDTPMQFITLDIAYMVKDEDNYRYMLLIGDLYSKYITAVPLQEQGAEDICDVLREEWILVHGTPNFLLTDQGSNVDGNTMRKVCEKFGIEKRRTSAYHSQGNGFAERSIRNVKEAFRTHLLDNRMHQKKWRSVLKDIVFALNTTVSASTKKVPYSLVFARDAALPTDVKLGVSKEQVGRHVISAEDYAVESKLRLEKAFDSVNNNLAACRARMEKNYNKSTKLHPYSVEDEVWIRKKNFKCGESEKLAPRRTGPWSIVEIKENGRNFLLRNCSNGRTTVVHHDRMEPVRRYSNSDGDVRAELPIPDEDRYQNDQVTGTDDESDGNSDSSDSDATIDDMVAALPERRFPTRQRTRRQVPGTVSWDDIDPEELELFFDLDGE